MKAEGPGIPEFSWQAGYAAFSVSQSSVADVIRYIEAQEVHHRLVTFQDELRKLFLRHEIEFNEIEGLRGAAGAVDFGQDPLSSLEPHETFWILTAGDLVGT